MIPPGSISTTVVHLALPSAARAASASKWPKTAAALTSEIKRAAPALRRAGIDIEIGVEHAGRFVHLFNTFNNRESSSRSSRVAPGLFPADSLQVLKIRAEVRAALAAGRLDALDPAIRSALERIADGESDEAEALRAIPLLEEINK